MGLPSVADEKARRVMPVRPTASASAGSLCGSKVKAKNTVRTCEFSQKAGAQALLSVLGNRRTPFDWHHAAPAEQRCAARLSDYRTGPRAPLRAPTGSGSNEDAAPGAVIDCE